MALVTVSASRSVGSSHFHAFIGALALGAVAGCGSDGATIIDQTSTAATPGRVAVGSDDSPLYVMAPRAQTPDYSTSYLVTLPSLDAGTVLSFDQGIEFPGIWSVMGIDRYPSVW